MSGSVKDNVFGSSGTVAAAAGGLSWDTAVVTGSTVTVEAANGYFINTTSNACTITLPSSAEAGDQIILIDYARTWGTNAITIDSNGLNFQGDPDTYTVDYNTAGQSINLVYADSTNGWIPTSDITNALDHVAPPTQRALFAFGHNGSALISLSNIVDSSGGVGSDVSGVGTARRSGCGATYGLDKGIIFGGFTDANVGITNLVSNSGVVASDVSAVGTARQGAGAMEYGGDKAIIAYGYTSGDVSMSNLVNSSGVVASDVTGVGTARSSIGDTGYGADLGIFAYGGANSMSNLVTNTGVIGSDVTGVGSARTCGGAARYSTDRAIFCGGNTGGGGTAVTNLVSSVGVVASDTAAVHLKRTDMDAARYGSDKAILAYGYADAGIVTTKNLINNSGVVAADATGAGTARYGCIAVGFENE